MQSPLLLQLALSLPHFPPAQTSPLAQSPELVQEEPALAEPPPHCPLLQVLGTRQSLLTVHPSPGFPPHTSLEVHVSPLVQSA